MAGVEVLQTRVPVETASRVDEIRGGQSRADWLRALVGAALEPASPVLETARADGPAPPAAGLAGGIPSPGVACSHSGCWYRDTAARGPAA